MSRDDELVLGLAREDIPGGLDWRGVRTTDLQPYLAAVGAVATFRRRGEAEQDPSWKQVIPYLALRDGERLFLMRRTRAGGDSRLFERYSIGIGGHINPGDGGVLPALVREWREELVADFEPAFEPIGVLNDDDNPVGAVHLGLVYTADAAGRPVEVRETEKLGGSFATQAEVRAVADSLETWSALLFDHLAASFRPRVG
jgi:predicted NUDIX family phosphoesterase